MKRPKANGEDPERKPDGLQWAGPVGKVLDLKPWNPSPEEAEDLRRRVRKLLESGKRSEDE